MSGLRDQNAVDDTDLLLLGLLMEDARVPFKTLAAEVGLTGPACAERIRKLRDRGYVEGFGAEVNATKLGFPIRAIVRIGANAEHGTRLIKLFKETINVIEANRVTGSDSYVLQVLARSSEELERIIDRLGTYGTITTSLVLSSPVTPRGRVRNLICASGRDR
ncbi:Lrp/AsnC family transcriptional regulator [Paraburkholderia sediminicola]|uniref:Lrp/AsnC family transcriptional regulator n=1 Tax=Paraburkholderia sediminicola TaxID=458836 RepID=UPI000EAB5FA1